MITLSLRLPNSLQERIRLLAEAQGVSINQFIATAVAEKMAALMTLEYLEERGKRGSQAHFRSILRRVPDVPPLPGDEWPSESFAAKKKPLRRKASRRTAGRKGKK